MGAGAPGGDGSGMNISSQKWAAVDYDLPSLHVIHKPSAPPICSITKNRDDAWEIARTIEQIPLMLRYIEERAQINNDPEAKRILRTINRSEGGATDGLTAGEDTN